MLSINMKKMRLRFLWLCFTKTHNCTGIICQDHNLIKEFSVIKTSAIHLAFAALVVVP